MKVKNNSLDLSLGRGQILFYFTKIKISDYFLVLRHEFIGLFFTQIFIYQTHNIYL